MIETRVPRAARATDGATEALAARRLYLLALLVACSVFAWAVSRPLDWLLSMFPMSRRPSRP